jgi:fatty acid-binding protein DegV
LIEAEFHPKEIDIQIVGAAVGSHSGPGTLAIFFTGKPS